MEGNKEEINYMEFDEGMQQDNDGKLFQLEEKRKEDERKEIEKEERTGELKRKTLLEKIEKREKTGRQEDDGTRMEMA